MVRIKGGTFQMGSDDGAANERPVHEVTVATFDLDITEVTVAAYKKCMADGKCTPPTAARASTFHAGDDTLPANFIDWHHAKLYCEQNGKRLPTEEEWEFAARGTGRDVGLVDVHAALDLVHEDPDHDGADLRDPRDYRPRLVQAVERRAWPGSVPAPIAA